MASKFLKNPNGGIYKDSNGKPIAVEPERVIRDIDGNIPASTLEDISVSTGTASTNGVTYIRATMKGEVTYTDNTHDTINYNIDLPIKAGDGVTIEAQPIAGGTGNKQLVISASGGGGGTLNVYTATASTTTSNSKSYNPLLAKIVDKASAVISVTDNNDNIYLTRKKTQGVVLQTVSIGTSNLFGYLISLYVNPVDDTDTGYFQQNQSYSFSVDSSGATFEKAPFISNTFKITYLHTSEITL